MKNKKLLITAILLIVVVVLPLALFGCNKDKGEVKYGTLIDYVSKKYSDVKDPIVKISQASELSIPGFEAGKDYRIVALTENFGKIVFAEDAESVASVVVYDFNSNTSKTFALKEETKLYTALRPYAGIDFDDNGLLTIEYALADGSDIKCIYNDAGEEILNGEAINVKKNIYRADGVYYEYANGQMTRLKVPVGVFDIYTAANKTYYNNGYFQVCGNQYIMITDKNCIEKARFVYPSFIDNDNKKSVPLPNGDVIIQYATEVEETEGVVTPVDSYTFKDDTNKKWLLHTYILSTNGALREIPNFDYVLYNGLSTALDAEFLKEMGMKLIPGYCGALAFNEIIDKQINVNGMEIFVISDDSELIKMNAVGFAAMTIVDLIADNTFVIATERFEYVINPDGSIIGVFEGDTNYTQYYAINDAETEIRKHNGELVLKLDEANQHIEHRDQESILIYDNEAKKYILYYRDAAPVMIASEANVAMNDYTSFVLADNGTTIVVHDASGAALLALENADIDRVLVFKTGYLIKMDSGKFYAVR